MTYLTPEELDEARAAEAMRRGVITTPVKSALAHLCDVFNEGWTPPPKVDQGLSRPSPVDEVVAASRILIRDIWQSASGGWHITGGDSEIVVTNLQNALAAYDKAKGETQ